MAVEILKTYGQKLNCQTCDEKLKQERGHDKEGIVPFLVDGKTVFRCPLMLITPLSWEFIKAFNFFNKGFLPHGETYTKETNKYIQAMMHLENLSHKVEESKNAKR